MMKNFIARFLVRKATNHLVWIFLVFLSELHLFFHELNLKNWQSRMTYSLVMAGITGDNQPYTQSDSAILL